MRVGATSHRCKREGMAGGVGLQMLLTQIGPFLPELMHPREGDTRTYREGGGCHGGAHPHVRIRKAAPCPFFPPGGPCPPARVPVEQETQGGGAGGCGPGRVPTASAAPPTGQPRREQPTCAS